jgi:charged multivesicular body protein 7
MKSYETSTATLKAVLAHPSLERTHVDETLEALTEANATAREVDDAIRAGTQLANAEAGREIDDDEIEAELAALARDAEREKANSEAARTPTMPSVPVDIVGQQRSPAIEPAEATERRQDTKFAATA